MDTTAHQLNSYVQHSSSPCCNPRSKNHWANLPKPLSTKIALRETFKTHRRSRNHRTFTLQIELHQNNITSQPLWATAEQSTPSLLLMPVNGVANHANIRKTITPAPCWKTQHPIREHDAQVNQNVTITPPIKKMNQICLCNQHTQHPHQRRTTNFFHGSARGSGCSGERRENCRGAKKKKRKGVCGIEP